MKKSVPSEKLENFTHFSWGKNEVKAAYWIIQGIALRKMRLGFEYQWDWNWDLWSKI